MKTKSTSQIARTFTRNAILLAIIALALSAWTSVALADGCIGQTNWSDGNGNVDEEAQLSTRFL